MITPDHPFLVRARQLSERDDFYDLPAFYLSLRSRAYLVPALVNYGLPGDWIEATDAAVLEVLPPGYTHIRERVYARANDQSTHRQYHSGSYLAPSTYRVHVCVLGQGVFTVNDKTYSYEPGKVVQIQSGLTLNSFSGICEHIVYSVGHESKRHLNNWQLFAARKK